MGEQDDCSLLKFSVTVPKDDAVEFQVMENASWDLRIYPTPSGEIAGPDADGHGRNWKLEAPRYPQILTVKWDPIGSGSMKYSLRDVGEVEPSSKPKSTSEWCLGLKNSTQIEEKQLSLVDPMVIEEQQSSLGAPVIVESN